MTRQEVVEFFNGVELEFIGYYKYQFNYRGVKDDKVILVTYGGSSDNIYRQSFGNKMILNTTEMDEERYWYFTSSDDYVQFIEEV